MCKEKKACNTCSIKKLEEAAKVNLQVTSNTKRELIKQAKNALDSFYSIYDICEKQNIDVSTFMNHLDGAFTDTNEMLTLLVVQDSIEKN